MFSPDIYKQRQKILKESVGSGIIVLPGNVEEPINYASNGYYFRQDSTFLYYFGLALPDIVAVIDIDNNKSMLFGPILTMDDLIWTGPQPTPDELLELSGTDQFLPIEDCSKYLNQALTQNAKIHYLPPYRSSTKLQLSEWLGVCPSQLMTLASDILIREVVKMRSIKSDVEIEEMNKAADVTAQMFMAAMRKSKVGVREQEVVSTMESVALSHGMRTSFPTILSMHGETLHNHSHGETLQNGKLLLIDAGAETIMGYAGDRTRTLPIGGKFSQQQKDIYSIVNEVGIRTFPLIKPGVPYRDMHVLTYQVIAEGLKSLGILKGDPKEAAILGVIGVFMPHGLGHMIGLDVHDMENLGENNVGYGDGFERSSIFGHASLRMAKTLKVGHIVSHEPGIYFIPALIEQWKSAGKFKDFICYDKLEKYYNFGGIRLEDELLITDDGCRNLGNPYLPKSVEEIELIMSE